MHTKKQHGFIPILSLLLVVVLAVGIFLTVRYVKQRQNLQSHAAGLTLADMQNDFVTISGTLFQIGGQPFRYTGVNMYDLAADPDTHNYDCGPVYSDANLDASFSYFQQHNISVVRFWAFQTYVKGAAYSADWSNFKAHGPDWSGIDRAISYARKYGLKLIPVLENTSPDCTEGGAHWFASWFTTGYQQPYGNYPLSYPDWVKLIVTRYKDDPTIMSWMLMNEAGDEEPIPANWTPASNTSMGVYNFTQNMSQLIKSIDSKHLVTLGTIDGNRGGIGGPAYAYIHKLPTIDYVEAHDYGSDTMPMPGSSDGVTLPQNCSQTIACIVWESLNDIHKPVVIGEAGISAQTGNTQSLQTRATEFSAKINAFFNAAGAGYMIWHWNPDAITNANSMDFTFSDPLVAVLQQFGFSINAMPTSAPPASSGDVADQFVSVKGTQFYLGSQPFKFVGFDLFDAAATDRYQCAWWPRFSDAELNSALQYMRTNAHASVLRFWAYQPYTNGATDWSGIDKVLAMAKANGFKVIPVLEDGPGYCTTGPAGQAKWQYNNDTWYTDGYKVPYGTATMSYRDYVAKVVDHYKNDPTILGWMMMNEADTSKKDASGKSVLVSFATDIGGLIKSIDHNHLVTVGTQSNGASGASGSDFVAVYSVPSIDFTEGHDWGYWGSDTDPLPGSADGKTLPDPNSASCTPQYQSKIACSIANAETVLHKPFVIGEAGIAANDDATRTRRAQLLDAKMNADFSNGVAGYLVWQFNKVVDTEQYDVLQTTHDPLFAKMAQYAQPLPLPSPSGSASPLPTVLATIVPTVRPTAKPVLTPTPLPTPTPTPAPIASGTIEAETMSLPAGTGQVVDDTAASNGKALLITQNATATTRVMGALTGLTVYAKESSCFGDAHILVTVDGNYVEDTNITSSEYAPYPANDFTWLHLQNGPHTIAIFANNNWSFLGLCNRDVTIDKISVNGAAGMPVPTPTPMPILLTPSPTPRLTAQPTARPTSKPTAKPTPVPTSVPIISNLFLAGANMTFPNGSGAVYNDSTANNGKALVLYKNTIASGTITGSFGHLTIRAKEDACLGDPHINVTVDGNYVFDGNITTSSFANFSSNDFGYLHLANTAHTIQVIYNNDWSIYFCDRNVRIDTITAS